MRQQQIVSDDSEDAPQSGSAVTPHVTPSLQGNQWRETWASISAELTPATKVRVGEVLDRVFSHQGVQDAMELAEHVMQNEEILGLDAGSHSLIKLSSSNSPARAAAIRCKTMWEQSLPKEIKGARLLSNYRLLAQEIQSLEHQAMSPETPFGAMFDADRQRGRRRVKSKDTARAFVLDHLVDIMIPVTDTAQRNKAHNRLIKDRDIAKNVSSLVDIFGTGIIPLMCKSKWQST